MQGRLGTGRSSEKAAGKEVRSARLAAALKSNLHRRKAQARKRAAAEEPVPATEQSMPAADTADHAVPEARDASHESAGIVCHESGE